MRQYKFRVWDNFNERMVYDPYRFEPAMEHDKLADDPRFNTPFRFYEDWQDVDDGISRPCFVMQFIGLSDINGKEIYEGDILEKTTGLPLTGKTPEFRKLHGKRHSIIYHEGAFKLTRGSKGERHYINSVVIRFYGLAVIGNIYENKEIEIK